MSASLIAAAGGSLVLPPWRFLNPARIRAAWDASVVKSRWQDDAMTTRFSAENDPAGRWLDLMPNACDWGQPTSGLRGKWKRSAVTGKWMLYLDNPATGADTAYMIQKGVLSSSSPMSISFVIEQDFFAEDDATGTPGYNFQTLLSGDTGSLMVAFESQARSYAAAYITKQDAGVTLFESPNDWRHPTGYYGKPIVITAMYDGTTFLMYVNGQPFANAKVSTSIIGTITRLGTYAANPNYAGFRGGIYGGLVIDGVLTDREMFKLHRYLAATRAQGIIR